MRKVKFAITTLAATLLIGAPSAKAEQSETIIQSSVNNGIHVKLNQVTLIKLKEPIADALIGNPAIADITIQTGKSFIITGKSYGRTNIILLDKRGNTIFNKSINVDDQQENVVRLQRGQARVSYTCAPKCQPTPTLGDDRTYTKAVTDNIKDKMKGIGQAMSMSSGAQ